MGDDSDALDAMIARSDALNGIAGITGMLWWDGAHFAQVLEGSHDAVGRTMHRIRGDVRHADIAIVSDRAVTTRMFGTWGMKRWDTGAEATANTAFLIGLAASDASPAARRLYQVMLACDG
jgi:hypothetical protein